jgi:prevent-host-death family protein
MQAINIHDAKTRFSQLIEAAIRGEDVIIAKAGKLITSLSASFV